MPYIQRQRDITRLTVRLLCSTMLAATVAACANTPKTRGIPWWPQGPGSTSDEVLHTTDAAPVDTGVTARQAETVQASFAQPTAGYAPAVRFGDLYFVSGQIADDQASPVIAERDIEAQAHSAMNNVLRVLERHGLTSSNILSITLYLQDIADLSKADAVLGSYFRGSLPARSVASVNGLPLGSLVEVSVIAGK